MNRITALTLCIASLTLTACGGDYEANPIVITEGSKTTIVDGSETTVGEGVTVDQFSQTQLTTLQANIWQSSCVNGRIIELTFSTLERTATVYQYADTNCTTFASNEAQVTIAPYTVYEKVQDSSGFDMTRVEFRTPLIDTNIITRTVFLIESNRLYLGATTTSSLLFATELDFNNPYYSISESSRITIPTSETLEIPAEDFSITD